MDLATFSEDAGGGFTFLLPVGALRPLIPTQLSFAFLPLFKGDLLQKPKMGQPPNGTSENTKLFSK
jgi:hypothetical protein